MNVEINLITNAITNYIQKSYKMDAVALQLVSTTIINSLGYISDRIRSINVDKLIDDKLTHLDSSAFDVLITRIYHTIILVCLSYATYRYQLHYILWNFAVKWYNRRQVNKEPDVVVNTIVKYEEPKDNEEPVAVVVRRIAFEIDVSNIYSAIVNINKFINLHPEFFETHVGQKLIRYSEDEYYPIYKSKVYFKDSIHDVDGYLTTNYSVTTMNDKETRDYQMILNINKNEGDKKCYIKQISDYIDYQTKHGNTVKLVYYKILSKTMISHTFYDEELTKWYNDIKSLKESFFLSHKDYLMAIMEQKASASSTSSKATSWNNLILHGAPGTGKSSFIYRIATLLKMSIISIDLSLYIDKKKELYALFHGQEFSLPGVDTKQNTSKNCIIILEEFDNCIEKLIELENIYKYRKLLIQEQITRRQNSLHKKIDRASDNLAKITKPTKKVSDNASDISDDYDGLESVSQRGHDEEMSKDEDLSSLLKKAKRHKARSKQAEPGDFKSYVNDSLHDDDDDDVFGDPKTDKDLTKVAVDLDKIIRSTNEENRSDILRLSDLLELFQGPIPIKDRIIIATTNHFEKIRQSLPALFRPGRLTPLEFSYLDWTSLNELTKYYFNTNMKCDSFEVIIPTSQIIEMAIKHTTTGNNFVQFQDELIELNRK